MSPRLQIHSAACAPRFQLESTFRRIFLFGVRWRGPFPPDEGDGGSEGEPLASRRAHSEKAMDWPKMGRIRQRAPRGDPPLATLCAPLAPAGPRRAPVGDVVVVPLEVALKGLESAQVRDAAARGSHGVQGGAVQLASLGQGQAPLETQQSSPQGLAVLAQLCPRGVAIAVQVLLRKQGQRCGGARSPSSALPGRGCIPPCSQGPATDSVQYSVPWIPGLMPTPRISPPCGHPQLHSTPGCPCPVPPSGPPRVYPC